MKDTTIVLGGEDETPRDGFELRIARGPLPTGERPLANPAGITAPATQRAANDARQPLSEETG